MRRIWIAKKIEFVFHIHDKWSNMHIFFLFRCLNITEIVFLSIWSTRVPLHFFFSIEWKREWCKKNENVIKNEKKVRRKREWDKKTKKRLKKNENDREKNLRRREKKDWRESEHIKGKTNQKERIKSRWFDKIVYLVMFGNVFNQLFSWYGLDLMSFSSHLNVCSALTMW